MPRKSPISPETETLSPDLDELVSRAREDVREHQRGRRSEGAPRQKPEPDPRGPRRNPKAKARKSDTGNALIEFVRDSRVHCLFGIVLCISALVSACVCISFIYNAEADQSVTHMRTVREIVAAGDYIGNAGEAVGAKLAHWLMVDTLGLGSFIIATWVAVMGLVCMKVVKVSFWKFSFRCFFSAASVSLLVGFFTFNHPTVFPLGGQYGQYFTALSLLYTGALGTYAIALVLLAALGAIFFNTIKSICLAIGRLIPKKAPASVAEEPTEEEDLLESLTLAGTTGTTDARDAEEPSERPAAPALASLPADDIPGDDIHDDQTKDRPAENPEEEGHPEIPETTPKTDPDGKADPEMIIVSKTADTADDPEPTAPVHGAHIGLDTPYDPTLSHSAYKFPTTDLLTERNGEALISAEEHEANKQMIIKALRSYDVEIQRIEATVGPTVTLYEIVPVEGTRIAKIKSLEDDIAMSIAAEGIRIIAPMPGRGTIGIEVPKPKQKREIVSMRTVLESKAFRKADMALPMALGVTISNEVYVADLAKLPHLLVAGATGQGKSVGLNCIITSLLYSKHPDELKFVLIDPKKLEFSLYRPISNAFLAKIPGEDEAIITDSNKAMGTLNSLCVEMDARYDLLRDAGVRDIKSYNEKFRARLLSPNAGHRFLPYIVVIVDEYADLIANVGKEISLPIARLAAKARAAGLHIILATQRPSTDVVNGTIKNNFPARIAFKVLSSIDSKTILDRPGAHRLIGRGDMLTLEGGLVTRVQCAYLDESETEAVCDHIMMQDGFTEPYALPEPIDENSIGDGGGADLGAGRGGDEFMRCALYIASQNTASITQMQRKFEIGFNKAGRYMDQMEKLGIVGPANGAKPREVRMTPEEVARVLGA